MAVQQSLNEAASSGFIKMMCSHLSWRADADCCVVLSLLSDLAVGEGAPEQVAAIIEIPAVSGCSISV